MGTNKTLSQPTRRRRRMHSPQFKAELVAICQQPGISMAAIALDHGINANLLRRWVTEHERCGKHSLPDDGDGAAYTLTRDMSPANWIPLQPSLQTVAHRAVAPAPAKSVDVEPRRQAKGAIEVELAVGGITFTVRWPGDDPLGLANWTRALLT